MADGTTPSRGARLVSMDEVCTLLDVERRTIERWIGAGKFPAPARIGENKVAFPLVDLVAWGKKKGASFASEVERLANARAADLRPEALDKQIAKKLTRQFDEKVTPEQTVTGRVAGSIVQINLSRKQIDKLIQSGALARINFTAAGTAARVTELEGHSSGGTKFTMLTLDPLEYHPGLAGLIDNRAGVRFPGVHVIQDQQRSQLMITWPTRLGYDSDEVLRTVKGLEAQAAILA